MICTFLTIERCFSNLGRLEQPVKMHKDCEQLGRKER